VGLLGEGLIATDDLIDAAARVQADWMAAVARATGGLAWEDEGVWIVASSRELVMPFPEQLADDVLDRVLTWVAEHDVRTVGCWAARQEQAALGPTLEARGFEDGWEPNWMATGTGGGGDDARVAATADVPEWDRYGQQLLALVSERTLPFVARVEGELAGFAWLHAPPGETVAGIFDVVVFPKHRRRGLGRALTAAASARAAELGRTQITLNATGEGELLYRAMGFEALGRGRTWWLHLVGPA
jgi:ribosomal protein S18 acetylase RimI-like enzyme